MARNLFCILCIFWCISFESLGHLRPGVYTSIPQSSGLQVKYEVYSKNSELWFKLFSRHSSDRPWEFESQNKGRRSSSLSEESISGSEMTRWTIRSTRDAWLGLPWAKKLTFVTLLYCWENEGRLFLGLDPDPLSAVEFTFSDRFPAFEAREEESDAERDQGLTETLETESESREG